MNPNTYRIFATVAVILQCNSAAFSQEAGSVRPRRSLDQFDLLSARGRPADPSVTVTRQAYELLGTLVDYCRKLENEYNAIYIRRERDVEFTAYYESFKKNTLVIYRSIDVVKTRVPEGAARELLKSTQQLIKDMHETLFLMPGGDNAPYKGRLVEISQKYSVPEPEPWYDGSKLASRRTMIITMLARLNADLARIKPDFQ